MKRHAGFERQIALSREKKTTHLARGPARLIEDVAQRADRQAFTTLFELFAPKVRTYMLRCGLTPMQADELAQETLLTVGRKAGLFEASRDGAAWTFTIARNLRTDRLRRETREARALLNVEEPEAPAGLDRELISVERERRVRSALARLTAEQRRVVELSYFREKPHPAIAAELAIPLGTVKSRIRLAMKRLRELLDEAP